MAFGAGASGGGRRRGRSRSHSRGALAEINVTPLVDVMLVLLIIFMISAPLLSVGVPVELPKTDAAAMDEQTEPLTVTIRKDGSIFLADNQIALDDLAGRLSAMSGAGPGKKPIYVRADGGAAYAVVAQVMAKLSTNGFGSINLVTDTGDEKHAAPTAPERPAP
jgi:biopolymer transport protein TolR